MKHISQLLQEWERRTLTKEQQRKLEIAKKKRAKRKHQEMLKQNT